MYSNIASPSITGNPYVGRPPFVYTNSFLFFNIDDDSCKGESTQGAVSFPVGDQFSSADQTCYSYTYDPPKDDTFPHYNYPFSPSAPPMESPEEVESVEEEFQQESQSPPSPGPPFLPYGSQAASAHNRRMIFPYTYKKRRSPGSKETNTSSSMRDEPLLLYRFFEFYCNNCEQCWLSPLFRAKNGCYCRMCHHFILPRGIRHSFTPYLGKETCYGKYSCHLCHRGWSSYKSLSNRPDQCFECGTLVYPYYQIAHSVLSQKIHKNTDSIDEGNEKSAFLKCLLLNKSSPRHDSNLGGRRQHHKDGKASGRSYQPRKITSTSGLHHPLDGMSGKPVTASKKRLHCLNNNPFLRHSTQQVRRLFHLKNCFSEPTISNSIST